MSNPNAFSYIEQNPNRVNVFWNGTAPTYCGTFVKYDGCAEWVLETGLSLSAQYMAELMLKLNELNSLNTFSANLTFELRNSEADYTVRRYTRGYDIGYLKKMHDNSYCFMVYDRVYLEPEELRAIANEISKLNKGN